MNRVRVLLAVSPELLQSVVERLLSGQEGITIVAEVASRLEAVRAARRLRPDVLVVGQRRVGLSRSYRELLLRLPELRIIAIAPDGSAATVFELRLRQVHVEELSPADLLSAIASPPPPFL